MTGASCAFCEMTFRVTTRRTVILCLAGATCPPSFPPIHLANSSDASGAAHRQVRCGSATLALESRLQPASQSCCPFRLTRGTHVSSKYTNLAVTDDPCLPKGWDWRGSLGSGVGWASGGGVTCAERHPQRGLRAGRKLPASQMERIETQSHQHVIFKAMSYLKKPIAQWICGVLVEWRWRYFCMEVFTLVGGGGPAGMGGQQGLQTGGRSPSDECGGISFWAGGKGMAIEMGGALHFCLG